ncbi:MAG: putative metal-binding motif-containing protein [Candidatus Nanoarchaeia archaeon]
MKRGVLIIFSLLFILLSVNCFAFTISGHTLYNGDPFSGVKVNISCPPYYYETDSDYLGDYSITDNIACPSYYLIIAEIIDEDPTDSEGTSLYTAKKMSYPGSNPVSLDLIMWIDIDNDHYTILGYCASPLCTCPGDPRCRMDCVDTLTNDPAGCPTLVSGCTSATSACAICINPGATEICDGKDNNCDNSIDEGGVCPTITYYCNTDNDGYFSSTALTCNTYNCKPTSCQLTAGNDCDDTKSDDPTGCPAIKTSCITSTSKCAICINSGATEVCDGKDNDCINGIDENVNCGTTLCTAANTIGSCSNICAGISGCSTCIPICTCQTGFCDQDNNMANGCEISTTEICNSIDDDCDNSIDEDLTRYTYYQDSDGDGYGNSLVNVTTCDSTPPTGYVTNDDDCDDTNLNKNPGAVEICENGIDEDCSGFDKTPCDCNDISNSEACLNNNDCYWDFSANSCFDCALPPLCAVFGLDENYCESRRCGLPVCVWDDTINPNECKQDGNCGEHGGDYDSDGICDDADNCVDIYNPSQNNEVCMCSQVTNQPNTLCEDIFGIGTICDEECIGGCFITSSDSATGKCCVYGRCGISSYTLSGTSSYELRNSECINANEEGIGTRWVVKFNPATGNQIGESYQEPCAILPKQKQVPFFSLISAMSIVFILTLFYVFKRKSF